MKTLEKSTGSIITMFWSIPSHKMLSTYKAKCGQLHLAIKESKTVELLTNTNTVLKFKDIGVEAGKFFGLENINGGINRIHLNINNIKKVTLL